MMKYCAFLRGVNVKGTAMKMAEVCNVFSKAGVKNVSSVLATGNILFTSEKEPSELKIILEKHLSDYFNYEAFLFIKSEKELGDIISRNPFRKLDDFHVYTFIGQKDVAEILLKEFESTLKIENEKGEIVDDVFYWQITKGNTLDSDFGKILGRKALKDKMTSRNINTIEKIATKFNNWSE